VTACLHSQALAISLAISEPGSGNGHGNDWRCLLGFTHIAGASKHLQHGIINYRMKEADAGPLCKDGGLPQMPQFILSRMRSMIAALYFVRLSLVSQLSMVVASIPSLMARKTSAVKVSLPSFALLQTIKSTRLMRTGSWFLNTATSSQDKLHKTSCT
jgi:hypothetical protein